MTVLHIVPKLNHGGVEKALLDLAVIWKKYNMGPFQVLCNGGSMVPYFEKEGATIINEQVDSKNPFVILKNVFLIKKIVKKLGVKVIHVHSRAPAWSAFFIKNTPYISTYHGVYKSFSIIKSFYNSSMIRGKYVIAVSKFVEDYLKNLESKAKIVLIPQGINTEYFSKTNNFECKKLESIDIKHPMILCPARLSWTKGQDVFLNALKTLPDNLSVIFLGDGKSKYKNYLKDKAKSLPQDIHFISSVFDLRPWYLRSSMVVVPSIVPESFGRVCLEAIAMETPFIGTTIGATKEVSCGTAFLCPPNHPKALAQSIWTVLSLSDKDRLSIIKKGREKISNSYSLDVTMKKLKDLYQTFY